MDFEEAQRILRRLDLPKGGFEDVLDKLDELNARAPIEEARSFLRPQPKIAKTKGSRAA